MTQLYIKQEDVSMRLNGTWCMYDGQPHYIQVHPSFPVGEVSAYDILDWPKPSRNTYAKSVKIEDPKFSIVFPSLGYVNKYSDCYYLTRNPSRKQKQGLCSSSVVVKHPKGGGYGLNDFGFSQEFVDMVHNKYPSFKDAFALIMDRAVSGVAIHKDIAMRVIERKLLGMYHKDHFFGLVSSEGLVVPMGVTKEFKFIKPLLDELKVEVKT